MHTFASSGRPISQQDNGPHAPEERTASPFHRHLQDRIQISLCTKTGFFENAVRCAEKSDECTALLLVENAVHPMEEDSRLLLLTAAFRAMKSTIRSGDTRQNDAFTLHILVRTALPASLFAVKSKHTQRQSKQQQ